MSELPEVKRNTNKTISVRSRLAGHIIEVVASEYDWLFLETMYEQDDVIPFDEIRMFIRRPEKEILEEIEELYGDDEMRYTNEFYIKFICISQREK